MPCQALVRMLAKKPGWKETNFQVFFRDVLSFIEVIFITSSYGVLERCSLVMIFSFFFLSCSDKCHLILNE